MAGGAAAPREEVAVVREAASPVVVAAVVAALLPCRDHPRAHRRLVGPVVDEEALPVGQATVIYLGRALVSATVRAVATLRIVQARVDRALVLVPVLEHGRESVRARVLETLQVADARRRAICRIFSICQTSGVEASVPAGHRPGHQRDLVMRRPDLAARWPEARRPNSCPTVRAIRCQEKVADPARVISQARCPRVRALVTASGQAAVDPISAAPGNLVIDPATLAVPVRLAIGQLISADLAHRAIGPATSADREGLAIVSKTFRAAFAIPLHGRIGARKTAVTSETGGKTIKATWEIGMATIGGATITSTGPTTQASVTGDGPPGRGSRTGSITVGPTRSTTTTERMFITKTVPCTTVTSPYARKRCTLNKRRPSH